MAQPRPCLQSCMQAFTYAGRQQADGSYGSQYAFYGPYIDLLYTLFGVPSLYYVDLEVPRPEAWLDYPVLDEAPDNINLDKSNVSPGALFTVLLNHKHPVFFSQLNPAFALSNPARRADAHQQVVSHFKELVICRGPDEGPVTPWLAAVSAFGTKMCFYKLDTVTNELSPSMPEVPPIEQWDCDMLEEEGAARFRQVVEAVVEQCRIHEE